MKHYTVQQLAKLSGVSVRTLHHYDEIGLLKPAFTGDNRYRYYGWEELLRLQQILFYRELGMPLLEIAALLDDPGFDRIAALRGHRERLVAEAERHRRLIQTIDRTIVELTGAATMNHTDLYDGFTPEKQSEYERWLVDRYGAKMQESIDRSRKKLGNLDAHDRRDSMMSLAEIEGSLVAAFQAGLPPDANALAPKIERHRAWVATMWNRPCLPDAYAGLADLYRSHPDFVQRYETLAPGFCEFLVAAMKAHAMRLENSQIV